MKIKYHAFNFINSKCANKTAKLFHEYHEGKYVGKTYVVKLVKKFKVNKNREIRLPIVNKASKLVQWDFKSLQLPLLVCFKPKNLLRGTYITIAKINNMVWHFRSPTGGSLFFSR